MLIEVIEGRTHPNDVPDDPVDVEREAMMYMKEKWEDVYHQLACSDEYFACWDCPAARSVACAVEECDPGIIKRFRRGDV